jgi:hypothetical protein
MAMHRHTKQSERSFGHVVADVATRVGQGVALAKGIYDTGRTVYTAVQAAAPYVSPLLGML